MNIVELQKKSFYHVGKMIAMSLVHGGPGPHFFTPAVADYIMYGMVQVRATPLDVPEDKIQKILLDVLM